MNSSSSASSHWDPQKYLRFADQRTRPALELLARVSDVEAQLVIDLGCGTGHVTRLMATHWPGARVIGIDRSPEMLARARAEPVAIEWQQADIEHWTPDAAPDVLYSNAALHWIPDHDALFPRLVGWLAPGGALAVQMPLSWDLPSHHLARELLAAGGLDGGPLGSAALRSELGRKWVAETAHYHRLLAPLTRTLDLWETEYLQELEGPDPVFEWVAGTMLRPTLAALEPAARERFTSEYRRRLRLIYPPEPSGRTLYPFRRLFLVAMV